MKDKISQKKQIFEGIRILDFTQVIAGAYGTTVMGDMGAEVVKVEPPVIGDGLRMGGPMVNGECRYFVLNNRNKKSISINLKTPEGMNIVKSLIPHFDIITENFKPGIMNRLGLGYEDARKLKEDIIYVSVSGFGQNNSYSDKLAYDNIVQAESGIGYLNGREEDGRPLRVPCSISDYTAAIYSAFSMASAIHHREKTGKGQYIDIAMYDALLSIMDNSFIIYQTKKDLLHTDEDFIKYGLKSNGNRHSGAPVHGFYRTKDGAVGHMLMQNEVWYRLLKLVGREDLIGDPRYEEPDTRKARYKETEEIVEAWTTQHTTAEVIEKFKEYRLAVGPVRTIDQAYENPHNVERGIFHEIEHPIAGKFNITNVPIKFSETPPRIKTPSPILGQHNEQILHDLLGYDEKQIADFTSRGILYQQETRKEKELPSVACAG